MIPENFLKRHKMSAVLQKALDLVERDYPKLEVNIARDGGEVVQLLLYDDKSFSLKKSLLASYNQWYPEEITYYQLNFSEKK